jgi:hypothetical protein
LPLRDFLPDDTDEHNRGWTSSGPSNPRFMSFSSILIRGASIEFRSLCF